MTLTPQHSLSQWDLAMDKVEEMDLSMVESPCELRRPEPSPFSSKRTMYETEEVRGAALPGTQWGGDSGMGGSMEYRPAFQGV